MHVQSISLRIAPILQEPGLKARVIASFAEVCNLVTDDDALFCLVSVRLGDGPLNAVVQPDSALALLDNGRVVTGDGRWLHLGPGWRLDLAAAQLWNPIPDYSQLTAWPQVVRNNLVWLASVLPLEAPPISLAAAPAYHTHGAFGSRPAAAVIQSQATELVEGLQRAYSSGHLQPLAAYASRLAGLGPGLTPAGDDWLAGWLVGLRACAAWQPAAKPPLPLTVVASVVVHAAEGRTNRLSLAFLHSAAAGALPLPWHHLIAALPSADRMPLRQAAVEIMRCGATSGADTLAGFLAAFD